MTEPKSIASIMTETRKFDPPAELSERAWVGSMEAYDELYRRSIEDPDGFWTEMADDLEWFSKDWERVRDFDFVEGRIEWFKGGKLNVTVNCLDRHLETRGDQPALLWEGDDPADSKTLTYRELHAEVCRFANVLRDLGVEKGDRVTLYMPMVPELPVAMLACARIGAVHCIVFGGFSPDSIKDRMLDADSTVIVTSDEGRRGGRVIPMYANAARAMEACEAEGHEVTTCVVFAHTGGDIEVREGRDHWWHTVMEGAADTCDPEVMDAEDPLFILYTSGSTGKPKGVLHTCGGYSLYALETFKYIFDYHDGDIYWCTADIGWVTGHSYIVYGPLQAGAQSVMFEGVPTYPEPDRFWRVVEKYEVNQFYTAPTAIRAIMAKGDDYVNRCDLSSLRVLGSVGEPINPEAWMWYYNVVGGGRCPIVDTWWQTETGGILITPLPGATPIKPGSATRPFFGVKPKIIRQDGSECGVNEGGYLLITEPWPGQMRGVYGQPQRFRDTYFVQYPGNYFTGDGARIDEDGYYWLMGRVDDVINVSGHRIGTAEVESALVSHEHVAEAAVVGYPHDIKGQGIYAYVTLNSGVEENEALGKELVKHVSNEIGPIAKPDKLQFAGALPKTRSGKIMRRILRKIAEGEIESIGDTTTLADPEVVTSLVDNRR